MADALTGAAVAFAKTFSNSNIQQASKSSDSVQAQVSPSTATGISPAKAVELRGKTFQQLRCLQQLYDEGILNDPEYSEQK